MSPPAPTVVTDILIPLVDEPSKNAPGIFSLSPTLNKVPAVLITHVYPPADEVISNVAPLPKLDSLLPDTPV